MPLEWWFSPWVLGVLGLCVGSFLNVVVHRIPRMLVREWTAEAADILQSQDEIVESGALNKVEAAALAKQAEMVSQRVAALPRYNIVTPRSACPACGHQLAWHENMPLLGWLRLGGKCSACGTRISARYPVVELVTGLMFAAIGWRFGAQPLALMWCAFAAVLLAASFIDWETTLLPNVLMYPLLWGGLLASALAWTSVAPVQSIVGAVAGYMVLWTLNAGHRLLKGADGMGYGDFLLLGALGAWLGPAMLIPVALAASVVGIVAYGLVKLTNGLRDGKFIPFGPFLAGGGLMVMFIGPQQVMDWWLGQL